MRVLGFIANIEALYGIVTVSAVELSKLLFETFPTY